MKYALLIYEDEQLRGRPETAGDAPSGDHDQAHGLQCWSGAPASRRCGPAGHGHGDHRAHGGRCEDNPRRPVCRDQGAARRALSDRRGRPRCRDCDRQTSAAVAGRRGRDPAPAGHTDAARRARSRGTGSGRAHHRRARRPVPRSRHRRGGVRRGLRTRGGRLATRRARRAIRPRGSTGSRIAARWMRFAGAARACGWRPIRHP